MPQVAWPVREITCSTLSGAAGSTFLVRNSDQKYLPIGQEATYVRTVGGTTSRSQVWVGLSETAAKQYQLFSDAKMRTSIGVVGNFRLELDAGVIVNYPSRPILGSQSLVHHSTKTNPLQVHAYETGQATYSGSVEIYVVRDENAGIVEAFIDQLHDPRNWFEIPLPGDHLSTSDVTAYDPATHTISISKNTDDSYHGWWVRVGRRTGRIVWHRVHTTINNEGNFVHTHDIRVVPETLITGTTAANSANNFSSQTTMRVRATAISATGHSEYSGSWSIDFQETDGNT